MNVICLVVDRLHTGFLGCYGNSWISTPATNRLAAESFLFDHSLADTTAPGDALASLWSGSHLLERAAGRPTGQALPAILRRHGLQSTLISDDPAACTHPLAREFDELVALEAPHRTDLAADVAETHLAAFFAAAADWLCGAREPFLLWLHARGMDAPWDAPYELRSQYADEDEPPPDESAHVPSFRLNKDYDPDELLAIHQAYAGQVSLLDACLGGMAELVRQSLADSTLLVFLGMRGFPLGIHGAVGAADETLHSELVQIPWLMRFPGGLGGGARSQALVQPCDLASTLLEWLDIPSAGGPSTGSPSTGSPVVARSLMPLLREQAAEVRDRVCLAGRDGERALRTAAWYLRSPGNGSAHARPDRRLQLFAKPDDRWEVNDVADRCAPAAECLEGLLAEYQAAIQQGDLAALTPLAGLPL